MRIKFGSESIAWRQAYLGGIYDDTTFNLLVFLRPGTDVVGVVVSQADRVDVNVPTTLVK